MPDYYHCISFQSIGSGSRNENYHVYCDIYDEHGNQKPNEMKDRYFGKWKKCEQVIRKFEKQAARAGNLPVTVEILNKIKNV